MLTADGSAVEPTSLLRLDGMLVLAYDLTLPLARDVGYRFDGEDHRVECALEGDLSIAYVYCNGQERGDQRVRESGRERGCQYGVKLVVAISYTKQQNHKPTKYITRI